MDLNLDTPLDVESALLPWDFTVVDGGNRFATRAPLLGEVAALERLSSSALQAMIVGLFVGPARPDVAAWNDVKLTRFLTGYLAAFTGHLAKNSRTIATAAAMEAAGKPAGSSPGKP